MNTLKRRPPGWLGTVMTICLLAAANAAWAVVDGIAGPVFNLTAKADYISTGDGNSVFTWGYANGAGTMQYPGPTLIVNQGEVITVNLSNELPVPVSIVFPGQEGVAASGGSPGLMTSEAPAMAGAAPGTVSYTFTATQPGTYLYHSGTQPSLQVEMGLVGALIVRPNAADPLHQAYGHPGSRFDREYLFLLTEMDQGIHDQVLNQTLAGLPISADTSSNTPVMWFINGRNAPDTLQPANSPWFPTQPYNAMPRMHPGERILMRVIGAGHDAHPFHTHGNNVLVIGKDGRLLESAPGAGPDLAYSDFTLTVVPGETYDALFEWTGKGLGWDIYGTVAQFPHSCTPDAAGYDVTTREWCADHDKPLPVTLPNIQDLTISPYWSGSPFLGQFGALPPGQTVETMNGGYFHMWHSHNEKEIVNNDIFPGGMMTMVIIEPPGVTIP